MSPASARRSLLTLNLQVDEQTAYEAILKVGAQMQQQFTLKAQWLASAALGCDLRNQRNAVIARFTGGGVVLTTEGLPTSRALAELGMRAATAMKQLLVGAPGAWLSSGCTRYCRHRDSATRLAQHHRPLSHQLDWRFSLAASPLSTPSSQFSVQRFRRHGKFARPIDPSTPIRRLAAVERQPRIHAIADCLQRKQFGTAPGPLDFSR